MLAAPPALPASPCTAPWCSLPATLAMTARSWRTHPILRSAHADRGLCRVVDQRMAGENHVPSVVAKSTGALARPLSSPVNT